MTTFKEMNHKNLIVVHFNPYAGGKFFINCLSHNSGILPGLGVAHTHDHWLFNNESDEEKNRLKIARINSTIPPTAELSKWPSYELGCVYFWGALLNQLDKMSPCAESINLLQSNICFIVDHDMTLETFCYLSNTLPEARHIILHNSNRFQTIAAKVKKYNLPLPQRTLPLHMENCFYINVNDTYFESDKIKICVSDCLKWLGINECLDPNLDQYIKRYQSLHRL